MEADEGHFWILNLSWPLTYECVVTCYLHLFTSTKLKTPLRSTLCHFKHWYHINRVMMVIYVDVIIIWSKHCDVTWQQFAIDLLPTSRFAIFFFSRKNVLKTFYFSVCQFKWNIKLFCTIKHDNAYHFHGSVGGQKFCMDMHN